MKKTAFITGATAGIGEATARILADNSFRLILCGRRKERLNRLKEELSEKTEVFCLDFDVRDKTAVKESVNSLPEPWKQIDILVNNAGNAHGMDFFHEGNMDDWENMIDINVKGLLYVSAEIIPGMVDRKSGQVINIGSIAGKEAYPKGNVYCASKHAVDAINNGMRMDLYEHGIKVSQVCPGLVNTEFSAVRFKGDKEKADKVYQGMTPLYAEDIADIILFMVTRPKHVNLADILVLPTDQAASVMVYRKGE